MSDGSFERQNKAVSKVDCDGIYQDEMGKSLKTQKRFQEAWLNTPPWDSELFLYSDPDFYFYRFAINRQESNTNRLMLQILYGVMERYRLPFVVPDGVDPLKAPFAFIIKDQTKHIGFRLSDFEGADCKQINSTLRTYGVDEAVIIRLEKHSRFNEYIQNTNNQYQKSGLRVRIILLEQFFRKYLCQEEYSSFLVYLDKYINEIKAITGYKTISFLSSMNLASQKTFAEKWLAEWDYKGYRYQIISVNGVPLQSAPQNICRDIIPHETLDKMERQYISCKLYKSMIGSNDYAESFITSEWLYHSLKGKSNFDLTSVISGYLKSIEQLLRKIVLLNIGNQCKIAMKNDNETRKQVEKAGIVRFEVPDKNGPWRLIADPKKWYKFPYIDLTESQAKYMDSSIGTFEYFLLYNPHIFIESGLSKIAKELVSQFRAECRNGYFHTHNLFDWDVVEKTRSNAIYLYFLLLGGCIIPQDKVQELGIWVRDPFDDLCIRIREFSKSNNGAFVLEYDTRTQNVIFDYNNNTLEYAEDGVEHYEGLDFIAVNDFSLETFIQLDNGISKEQIVRISRSSLPKRIFGVKRNKEQEEIIFVHP